MFRPVYETQSDLDREMEVARFLERIWDCKFHKTPVRYHVDFVISRGKVVLSYCEVKVRNYSMKDINNMGGYLISAGKWSSAKSLSESSGLPFTLVIKALDGIWYNLVKENFKPDGIIIGGRDDRHDWQDTEPCILINCDRFTKVAD